MFRVSFCLPNTIFLSLIKLVYVDVDVAGASGGVDLIGVTGGGGGGGGALVAAPG